MAEALLIRQLDALIDEDAHWLPVMANASALIYDTLKDLNWAGFYVVKDGRLVLGPFQGKPACIHIACGKGVCGTAWKEDRVLRVADVHAFPGHIACDAASASEIVIPIHQGGKVVAELDIDSPVKERFSEEDEALLAALVRKIEERTLFPETF